jgi:hypothetical protein
MHKGKFILQLKDCKVKDLGDTIHVLLRNLRTETMTNRVGGDGVTRWVYLVELFGDLKTHKFSAEALVELHVTDTDPPHCRIMTEMFMSEGAFGVVHTLKLHPCGGEPMLAVNGFIWDQRLIHIRDIVG